jgi:hypothetical protein
MKSKKIDVPKVISSIIDLGGEVMSAHLKKSEIKFTPEVVENLIVLAPLKCNGEDKGGYEVINIGEINLEKTSNNLLAHGEYEKEHFVSLLPELMKSLILLKLFIEDCELITA